MPRINTPSRENEIKLLRMLAEGRIQASALYSRAREAGMGSQAITNHLNGKHGLVRRGLVRRTPVEGSKPPVFYELSPTGERYLELLQPLSSLLEPALEVLHTKRNYQTNKVACTDESILDALLRLRKGLQDELAYVTSDVLRRFSDGEWNDRSLEEFSKRTRALQMEMIGWLEAYILECYNKRDVLHEMRESGKLPTGFL